MLTGSHIFTCHSKVLSVHEANNDAIERCQYVYTVYHWCIKWFHDLITVQFYVIIQFPNS